MEEDGAENFVSKRAAALGFKPQKEIVYNKFLPYGKELDEESKLLWDEIKGGLGTAVFMREMRPGCVMWTQRVGRYLDLYGLKFTKEDHIALVKLFYELLTIPDLDPYLVHSFAQLLYTLLKKKYLLTPEDIVLDWRPLFKIIQRIMDSCYTQLGMTKYFTQLETTLAGLLQVAKFYFPETATQEILDEFKPIVYPLGPTNNDMDVFEWFLPIALPPEKSHLGYKLWLTDIMDMWRVCNNSTVWEPEVMSLVSKLAKRNIGYIDWEPYIPEMFARFLGAFHLPVCYNKENVKKRSKIEVNDIALWIVSVLGGGSQCQEYLDKLLKTIETYVHPANYGTWVPRLRQFIWRLPHVFITRLRRERHGKPHWLTPVPNSHKLTEEDIDRFVESMKPVAMTAVFSRAGFLDVSFLLQHLATLRPNVIVPDLIERLYAMLDSVTEPHKLTSVMQSVVGVARALVGGPKIGYKEGPSHVLPMLLAVLPGIDPNDFRKCIVTFHFIQSFVCLVPLVDCSHTTATDLTEDEEELCIISAGFEDFVCQFLDRLLALVESSALETTRLDKNEDKRSRLENLSEKALTSVCFTVLSQSSPEIFQSALKKLVTFVTTRILETKVSGKFVAYLCDTFARVNSVETLKALLPYLTDSILMLTSSEEVINEHELDDELLYKLTILSSLTQCRREGLTLYMDQLTAVLDRCLYFSCRRGYIVASELLENILSTLTGITLTETRNYQPHGKDYLAIRDWGQAFKLRDLKLSWHVPSEEENRAAQFLLTRYIQPELDRIRKHVNGEETLSKERLLISLHIIRAIKGAEPALPLWNEEPIVILESCLPIIQLKINLGQKMHLTMPDGSNVRYVIAQTMDMLTKFLLENAEDDTKALFKVITITERLLLNKMGVMEDYETRVKSHGLMKKALANELLGSESRIRTIIVDRVQLQMECRYLKTGAYLTPTHKMLMFNLLKLSCSHYSEVRVIAQSALSKTVDFFPYSFRLLIPQLVENLELDPKDNHEKIKGSLFVLMGPKRLPLITRLDWLMMTKIWPAMVRCQPSEKLSIVQLMDSLRDVVRKRFPSVTLRLEIPDRCLSAARELWKNYPLPHRPIPTDADVEIGEKTLIARNKTNTETYESILDTLSDAAEDNSLHWRHHQMAVGFLRDLVHTEHLYPPRVVKLFLNTLISDSLDQRKLAIVSVVHILKQQKRKHPKKTIPWENLSKEPLPAKCMPGVRPDNLWLQYDSEKRPMNAASWDEPRYYHTAGFSYLQYPKEVKLYEPSNQQPKVTRTYAELLPEEKPIHEFFMNEENVAKLVTYFALEEKKGKDRFNGFKFILFKGLFRNHGNTFLHVFQPHLERLVKDKQESSQRCATEIIAGIIRGSKHWPFELVEPLWKFLIPLIQTALTNMTGETLEDWGICLASAASNRDPNRIHWLLECLMEHPLRNETSFMECGRLYALQSALNQQEWRVAECFDRLLVSITPFLDHPFENVRRRISSVLTNIFNCSICLPGGNAVSPKISEFMDMVETKLDSLTSCNASMDTDERIDFFQRLLELTTAGNGLVSAPTTESALRLLKTVLQWISGSLIRSNVAAVCEYYRLYPYMCLLKNYDKDDEWPPICNRSLSALSTVQLSDDMVPVAFNTITKVGTCSSWMARQTNIQFLQVLIFHNMPILRSRTEWASQATSLVMAALRDASVEVRVTAGEVLAGLLHCDFIPDPAALLADLTKGLKKGRRGQGLGSEELANRHSVILGLCAFVNSSPYDVPDCVPHIFYLLRNHLNDPQPIPSVIRKTLGDFKRTHYDDWDVHKLKFSDLQLEVFDDLIVPPSYCA